MENKHYPFSPRTMKELEEIKQKSRQLSDFREQLEAPNR